MVASLLVQRKLILSSILPTNKAVFEARSSLLIEICFVSRGLTTMVNGERKNFSLRLILIYIKIDFLSRSLRLTALIAYGVIMAVKQ